MRGDAARMTTCLDEVLSHVLVFEDSLSALSLRMKLLASSSKYQDAISSCLGVLSKLGEAFPLEVDLPLVLNELPAIQTVLRSITYDQIKLLPPMRDKIKLNAMKFLNSELDLGFICSS